MKEKIAAILCLLSFTLAIVALAFPVAAADGIPFRWMEPAYSGTDPSLPYSPTVIGYLEGTYWNFTMSWTNYYSAPINISAVRIYFSWGTNYTTTFDPPIKLDHEQTRIFSINAITPPVTQTSELWSHSYEVYIHHVNSTTAPYEEITVSTPSYPASPMYVHSGSGFVVLSADHLACLNLWDTLHRVLTGVDMSAMVSTVNPPDITKVQILMQKAEMEFYQGTSILGTGVFGAAKTHLQLAESLYNQALDTWDTRGTAIEDAELNNLNAETNMYNAEADATRKMADASLVNAYGWLLFGLGWTFLGIGAIIYGYRKPKAAQS